MRQVVDQMNMREVTIAYGMTETSPVSTQTSADVPDIRYGEEVMAWIQLRDGADTTAADIKDFCRDTIAHYKVPRHICRAFVPWVGMIPVPGPRALRRGWPVTRRGELWSHGQRRPAGVSWDSRWWRV